MRKSKKEHGGSKILFNEDFFLKNRTKKSVLLSSWNLLVFVISYTSVPIKQSTHLTFRVRLQRKYTNSVVNLYAGYLWLTAKMVRIFFVTHASIRTSEATIKRFGLTILVHTKHSATLLIYNFLKVQSFRKHLKPLWILGAKKLNQWAITLS